MNLITLCIIVSFFTLNLKAADCTQSFDGSEETEEEPQSISYDELTKDLGDSSSVRFQVKQNLLLSPHYHNVSDEVLLGPILCVGTGRNLDTLRLRHIKYTQVRSIDETIDKKRDLDPHYRIDDAFLDVCDLYKIPAPSFNIVFFAHVGSCLLPLDQEKNLKAAFRRYNELLNPQGLLVINSEVHQNEEAVKSYFSKVYKKNNFAALEASIITMLEQCGFVDVQFVTKQEKDYCEHGVSFLILARKKTN